MRKYRDLTTVHITSSRLSEIVSQFVCPLIKFYVSVEHYASLMWFAVKAFCIRDFTDHPEFCFCLWEFDRSVDPRDPAIAITIAISLVLWFLSGCPDPEVECREWSCFLILCFIWRQSYEGRFHLFVGGSGWVNTSPLYTFQEELVFLLLLLLLVVVVVVVVVVVSAPRCSGRCS